MKVTKNRIDAYLFQKVVVPIREIEAEAEPDNPFRSREMGGRIELRHREASGRYRHNYQRQLANSKQPIDIYFFNEVTGERLGTYSKPDKTVLLYADAWQRIGARFMMSRLFKMLDAYRPYMKVKIEKGEGL